jgi:hypothetical protein
MYLLVAWLALRVGRTEDAGGALAYLGTGAGRALLGGMALGFAGYAGWRLLDAGLDVERSGVGHRVAAAGSGAVHLGFAFTAAKLAHGGHSSGGSGSTAEAGAATAMSLPGGEALLFAAAAALLGGALFQSRVALKRRFLRRMTAEAAQRWWIVSAGIAGYAARGILFAVAAWLMFRAASDHKPVEAGGLGDSLAAMPPAVRAAVAAGLALFGLFSLLEAWYRVMRDPQVKRRMKRAVE